VVRPAGPPCAWALAALGLDTAQLVVCSRARRLPARRASACPAADVLWALEQALKSGHVGAVLAWLPARLPAESLRRLQLAAQAHDGPAFLLRVSWRRGPAQRRAAAPGAGAAGPAHPDELALRIVKRRGPPLAGTLRLALAPVLSAPARARAEWLAAQTAQGATAVPHQGQAAVAAGLAAAAGHGA
jgi:protein ImuA